MSDSYGQVEVTSRSQLRKWLAAHHADTPGAWIVTHKKAEGDKHVPASAVAEEALCVGWIDSQPRKLDDRRSQLLVTPRKPGSNWSRVNKERVARLEAAGLMRKAGRDAVAAAKQDGSWSALDDVEDLVEPDDLRAALDAEPSARASWDEFPRSAKRGILEWILAAKRAPTREKRIAETVSEAAQGRRANQWPRR